MKALRYVAAAFAAGIVVGAIVIGATSADDIKRYMRMRMM